MILDLIPEKKYITFCQTIQFAEDLKNAINNKYGQESCAIYHSKMKKDERTANLKMFVNNPKTMGISAAAALNAGYDVPAIEVGICCSGSSKELAHIQRTGRTLRLKEGKKEALYINLCVRDTQEEEWLKTRLNLEEITWSTLTQIKERLLEDIPFSRIQIP